MIGPTFPLTFVINSVGLPCRSHGEGLTVKITKFGILHSLQSVQNRIRNDNGNTFDSTPFRPKKMQQFQEPKSKQSKPFDFGSSIHSVSNSNLIECRKGKRSNICFFRPLGSHKWFSMPM